MFDGMYDALIIGAGVSGASLARELCGYRLRIAVVGLSATGSGLPCWKSEQGELGGQSIRAMMLHLAPKKAPL